MTESISPCERLFARWLTEGGDARGFEELLMRNPAEAPFLLELHGSWRRWRQLIDELGAERLLRELAWRLPADEAPSIERLLRLVTTGKTRGGNGAIGPGAHGSAGPIHGSPSG